MMGDVFFWLTFAAAVAGIVVCVCEIMEEDVDEDQK